MILKKYTNKHTKAMLKTLYIVGLSIITMFTSCSASGSSENDDLTLFALLLIAASETCTTLPKTWVANGATVNCSVSGLEYRCSTTANGGLDVVIAYPSGRIAKTEPHAFPLVANASPGMKATSLKVTGSLPQEHSYTFDGNNRLSTWTATSTSLNFSNYDTNGFPQSYSGTSTGSYAYTYAESTSLPTQMQRTPALQFNYSSGIMTSYDIGAGLVTVSSSGSQNLCSRSL